MVLERMAPFELGPSERPTMYRMRSQSHMQSYTRMRAATCQAFAASHRHRRGRVDWTDRPPITRPCADGQRMPWRM